MASATRASAYADPAGEATRVTSNSVLMTAAPMANAFKENVSVNSASPARIAARLIAPTNAANTGHV